MGCKSVDVGHFRVEVLHFIFDLYRLSGFFYLYFSLRYLNLLVRQKEKHINDNILHL